MKPTVLILCTGNSCRSQMAEGFLRHHAGDRLAAQSAGSRPTGRVHPIAVQVMAEVGIDISQHHSKSMEEFIGTKVDTVITVCGDAAEGCPLFPGELQRHHWGFADPAEATGNEEDLLAAFRAVRDAISLVFQAYAAGRKDSTPLTQPPRPAAEPPGAEA